MADFDDLINDAENFENDYNDEPDIPDEFLQEKVIESKKRVLENDQSHSNETDKRVKPAGCLADYFVNNNQSPSNDNGSKTVKNSNQQSNYSNQQSNYSNQQSNNTNQQSKGNHDNSQQSNYGTNTNTSVNNNESATVEEKGPLCACGMKSVSKTTFKEGPNKDRKFWICGQDRDSQCKFFEWRDALNSFDSEAPNQQQQFKSTGPNVFDEEKGPLCQCGQGSISKTTFKEGANKDRKFWVCGQDYDSKCKFFEWRDTPKPQAQSMGSNSMNHQQQQQQQKPISAGPQCKCGIPCVSRTTTKEGPNQGKAFWVSLLIISALTYSTYIFILYKPLISSFSCIVSLWNKIYRFIPIDRCINKFE